MKTSKKLFLFFFLITLTLLSCEKETPPATNSDLTCQMEAPMNKGNRILGIDLLNVAETSSFDRNLDLADELGMEFIALHVEWSAIEPTPGDFTDPFEAIYLLGKTAEGRGLKFSLTIRPIDLSGKTVPSDLVNTRFNTSEMVNRFKAVLDFVFTKVNPSILLNLQIGNEIDGYDTFGEHEDFWADYGIFLQEISDYVHSKHPEVKVGFTGTLYGMMQQPNRFKELAEKVDIFGVTYYPILSNFDVKSPEVVVEELGDLVNTFSDVPIYLQEVGYHSSAKNNSSEEKQAEFYCNFFRAWDTHQDNIKAANFVRLNDLSVSEAESSAAPYGLSSIEFIEYLRTLGLRGFDGEGKNKAAYEVIKENMKERGW